MTSSMEGGVGDYTRLLADECKVLGHEVALLAEMNLHAREFVDAFAPDAVSLQFVCYGYHSRGLCWRAVDDLRRILGARPVQLMLHELWLGGELRASWKDRILGWLQRRCVMRLYSQLNIRRTFTTNPAYAALLRRRGVDAGVLPLFGNVPSPQTPARMERAEPWRFLIFGTLHPVWPPEPLFTHLRALGVPVEIWHAGRIGSGAALWERMTHDFTGTLVFRKLGPKSPEQLAEIFADVDFGIATTPWEIIGKSGSVAAMLEHGLPVIVNRDDIHYAGWSERGCSPLLIKMDESLATKLATARRQMPRSILPEVAAQFLADIKRPPANSRDE